MLSSLRKKNQVVDDQLNDDDDPPAEEHIVEDPFEDVDDDDEPPLEYFDARMEVDYAGFEDEFAEEDFEHDDNEIIRDELLMEAIDDGVGIPLMVELGNVVANFNAWFEEFLPDEIVIPTDEISLVTSSDEEP